MKAFKKIANPIKKSFRKMNNADKLDSYLKHNIKTINSRMSTQKKNKKFINKNTGLKGTTTEFGYNNGKKKESILFDDKKKFIGIRGDIERPNWIKKSKKTKSMEKLSTKNLHHSIHSIFFDKGSDSALGVNFRTKKEYKKAKHHIEIASSGIEEGV